MITYRFHICLSAFLVGVGIGAVYTPGLPVIAWLSLLAFGVVGITQRTPNDLKRATLLTISFAIFFCSVGMIRFEMASSQFGHSVFAPYVGKKVQFEGEIVREPDQRATATHLYIAVEDELVLVTTKNRASVSYGDVVTVEGQVEAPESFTTDFGRTFDYPGYLLARGVEYRVAATDIEIQASNQGNIVITSLLHIKQRLLQAIEATLPEPHAGLAEGLLLGVKRALGEDIEEAFRVSGIIHIVVLSGYNVMLIVTFILFLASFLFRQTGRLVLGIISITLFALMVGLSATVVRASVMATLLLVATALHRNYELPRILLIAAAVMVAFNPYLLVYDIGFQFSFMATLGLILVAPMFESFVTEGLAKLSIKDFFISTVATQIAVLPLLMYHIGQVSLVAVVVNVLVLPIVPVAMLLTFLSTLTTLSLPALGQYVGFFAYLSLDYIIKVAQFFADLPLAAIVVPPISAWAMGGMYAGLAFVMYWFHHRNASSSIEAWTIEEEI